VRNGPIDSGSALPIQDSNPATGGERNCPNHCSTLSNDEEAGGSVESQRVVWETPEFDEVGVGPEVTMYIAQLAD